MSQRKVFAAQHDGYPDTTLLVQPEKVRYYQIFLDQDLFGDWTLITAWGGIGSNRNRMRNAAVDSHEGCIARIDEIARRRSRQG